MRQKFCCHWLDESTAFLIMPKATTSPCGPLAIMVPWPLPGSTVHPSGTPILTELSGAVTVWSFPARPERAPEAGPEAAFPIEATAVAASSGCHARKSWDSMGFTLEPNRAESSVTTPTSMRLGPVGEAMIIPAFGVFPCGWLTTVKKTASEFVPRSLKTWPTCGLSPQLLCKRRSTLLMACASVLAPSIGP